MLPDGYVVEDDIDTMRRILGDYGYVVIHEDDRPALSFAAYYIRKISEQEKTIKSLEKKLADLGDK